MKTFFTSKNIGCLVVAIIALVVIWICVSKVNTFERKIGRWIDRECVDPKECVVRITDLTEFDWDEMYVFDSGYTTEGIEKALGTKISTNNDAKRKIVFLKNKRIVLYEELKKNIEHYVDKEVVFKHDTQTNYDLFTPETAIFVATKHESGAGRYYQLIMKTSD